MSDSDLLALITAIGSVGAVAAAVAAWRSARATQVATEAQLFSTLYAEYGQPDMLVALRILRNWHADQGSDFAGKWKAALDASDAHAREVDRARRQVKFYFMRALRLYQVGYVSQRFLQGIVSVDGVNILYDIAEPLEAALNPKYDRSKFTELRIVCGRAGTKRLFQSVPQPFGGGLTQ